MKTETDMQVAQTISEQIGHRAFLMMGTRHRIADGNSLLFDMRGSRVANKVRVTLDASDTYTVEFFKVRGVYCTSVAKFSDIYSDGLNSLISETTGLALSL